MVFPNKKSGERSWKGQGHHAKAWGEHKKAWGDAKKAWGKRFGKNDDAAEKCEAELEAKNAEVATMLADHRVALKAKDAEHKVRMDNYSARMKQMGIDHRVALDEKDAECAVQLDAKDAICKAKEVICRSNGRRRLKEASNCPNDKKMANLMTMFDCENNRRRLAEKLPAPEPPTDVNVDEAKKMICDNGRRRLIIADQEPTSVCYSVDEQMKELKTLFDCSDNDVQIGKAKEIVCDANLAELTELESKQCYSVEKQMAQLALALSCGSDVQQKEVSVEEVKLMICRSNGRRRLNSLSGCDQRNGKIAELKKVFECETETKTEARRRLKSDSVGAADALYAADQIVCEALTAQETADAGAGAIELGVALNLNECVDGSQYVVVNNVLRLQTFSDSMCQAQISQFSTCAKFSMR